jgi:hypothetical protein
MLTVTLGFVAVGTAEVPSRVNSSAAFLILVLAAGTSPKRTVLLFVGGGVYMPPNTPSTTGVVTVVAGTPEMTCVVPNPER